MTVPPPPPHEARDASIRVILTGAGSLFVLIALGLGFAALLGANHRRLPAVLTFQHGPDERTEIAAEWPALDRAFRQHLETYGWIDRDRGVVRIPIEQAMRRLVARGEGGMPQ